eukprot:GSChrysophyteH1.ASY1.ANO1.1611.1 assembled CDS
MIISTSGRESSAKRYRLLLERLQLSDELQYSTFVSEKESGGPIDATEFTEVIKDHKCPCVGAAISKDIKGKIIPFLDTLDESASAVDSVNTVINAEGKLKGYNTDYIGFHDAIAHAVKTQQCKTAAIYGYGGVTNVVCHVLLSLGLSKEHIWISGRSLDKAACRASELGVQVWSATVGSVDIFINAAPVSEQPLVEAVYFLETLAPKIADTPKNPKIIFDHEMPGKCLREWATAHPDVTYISGYDMYYPQMQHQWKLFLAGRVAPETVVRELQLLLQEESLT